MDVCDWGDEASSKVLRVEKHYVSSYINQFSCVCLDLYTSMNVNDEQNIKTA